MFSWLKSALSPLVCRHEWQDDCTFASCVETTVPNGPCRPVCFRVWQLCAHCDAMRRRLLTKAEYDAWISELEAAWHEGDGYLATEWLRENFGPNASSPAVPSPNPV